MSNLTSVGEISLSELKPEYLELLTKESRELIDFLKPYYSKMQLDQHPVPTVLLNWFKDTSLNYQNLMHSMKISKYTISKVEEKTIRQGKNDKGYQERFQDEYENDNKKVKIMGFTNYETFAGSNAKKNPQFELPPEFKKILEQEGVNAQKPITQKHVNSMHRGKRPSMDKKSKRKSGRRTKKYSGRGNIGNKVGGSPHNRRYSRAKSMFRNYGDTQKYEDKIKFLNDTKPLMIKGLIVLYDQYMENPNGQSMLKEIFEAHYPLGPERDGILSFLENVKKNKMSVLEMSNWINKNGKYLIRAFGQLLTESKLKLPYELNKRLNYNVSMYNEFFPLVIQDYVEKRLNKRYEFTVEIPAGIRESDVIKLDLEVLSKSYFEPVEFPIFFNVKPSVTDPKYEQFIEKNKKEKTRQRRHKNISFMLARFLLMQSLHMPWINTKNISAKVMMTPFKKQLPYHPPSDKGTRMLGSSEINSGSRYGDQINIWRREELNKLIIHETTHQAEIDHTGNMGLDDFIRKHMAIDANSEIRLYEAYTEMCSVLINLFTSVYEMFLIRHRWDRYAKQLQGHFEYSPKQLLQEEADNKDDRYEKLYKPKAVTYRSSSRGSRRGRRSGRRSGRSGTRSGRKGSKRQSLKSLLENKTGRQAGGHLEGFSLDIERVIGEIKKVLMIFIRLEQLFSAYQTAKVLHHYGFDNINEFLRPKATQKRINQETSVLSYYIIKGGFMNSIAKFIGFVIKMNPGQSDEPIMNFKFKPDRKNEYEELIKDCVIYNLGYHKTVDAFMKEIRDKKLYPTEKAAVTEFKLNKTLRMTLIEVADEIYQ